MNIILYSEDNFVWTSMQEIIPGLVDCWMEVSKRQGEECLLLNLDVDDIKKHIPELMKAENIILTSFNIKISNAAILIREKLGIDAKIHFHLHGLASVGCWPIHEFGLGRILRSSDVFYSTCTRDQEAFELAYKNAKCEVVPFHTNMVSTSLLKVLDEPTLVFVGRLAEQKNLHQLLWVCSLIEKENPDLNYSLKIFGKPDHLGSPNMDINSIEYQEFLERLVEELQIKNVSFEGFVERNKLDKWISENKHIFISPSLHSDENFGIAALKSLMAGSTAILSDWGGHADFRKKFHNAVSLVNVHKGEYGPCIDPLELKNSIVEKLQKYTEKVPGCEEYQFENIVSRYETVLGNTSETSELLERTNLAIAVHEKRNKLIGSRHCQCFESYNDKNAQDFFKAYGMKDKIQRVEITGELAPWASETTFVDPHKGKVENINREALLTNGWLY